MFNQSKFGLQSTFNQSLIWSINQLFWHGTPLIIQTRKVYDSWIDVRNNDLYMILENKLLYKHVKYITFIYCYNLCSIPFSYVHRSYDEYYLRCQKASAKLIFNIFLFVWRDFRANIPPPPLRRYEFTCAHTCIIQVLISGVTCKLTDFSEKSLRISWYSSWKHRAFAKICKFGWYCGFCYCSSNNFSFYSQWNLRMVFANIF